MSSARLSIERPTTRHLALKCGGVYPDAAGDTTPVFYKGKLK